jgi:hypothetical protein
MNLIRAGAAMTAVLWLAGCAGSAAAEGHVAGQLLKQGGQSPGQRPMSGTIAFAVAGHPQVTVRVSDTGTFSVQLAPGHYRVTGPCSYPSPVTVTANHTTHIKIICILASGQPPSN